MAIFTAETIGVTELFFPTQSDLKLTQFLSRCIAVRPNWVPFRCSHPPTCSPPPAILVGPRLLINWFIVSGGIASVLKKSSASNITVNMFGKCNSRVQQNPNSLSLSRHIQDSPFLNFTLWFAETLADNRRLSKVNGIIKAFGTIMSAHRGEVQCTVTTAKVGSSVHALDFMESVSHPSEIAFQSLSLAPLALSNLE